MPSYHYDSTIPAASHSPKNDQGQMQTNAASISNIISVDHFGFDNTLGGYHNIIHLPFQNGVPAPITNVGQVYTRTIGSDQQLFYRSGAGTESQLTFPNVASSIVENGYIWIGNMMMQWGRVSTSTNNSGTVTFTPHFPTNVWNIQCTMSYDPKIPDGSVTLLIDRKGGEEPDITGFSWVRVTGTSKSTGFYWLAIGN